MRILVGVDGSEAATIACHFVASRAWPVGAAVELIAAYERPIDLTGLAPSAVQSTGDEIEALAIMLEDLAAPVRAAGLRVERSVVEGRPADVLIRRASEAFADLIVIGNRGLGPITSAVIGSVSAHLVDHAPCPVLVARSPGASRMLLATDGTASSRNIPSILAAWGNALRGLPVEVVSVAREGRIDADRPPPNAEPGEGVADADYLLHERIAEEVADELMDLGWHAAAAALTGDPEREILAEARVWKADLIVTGSRGLGTIRRLVLGSLSHDLLMHSQSSLLVVRGQVPARILRPIAVGGIATA